MEQCSDLVDVFDRRQHWPGLSSVRGYRCRRCQSPNRSTPALGLADALKLAGKSFEFIELDGEDHWLSQADTRTRTLIESMRFIETHNPAY